jgi:hypothetical protein
VQATHRMAIEGSYPIPSVTPPKHGFAILASADKKVPIGSVVAACFRQATSKSTEQVEDTTGPSVSACPAAWVHARSWIKPSLKIPSHPHDT